MAITGSAKIQRQNVLQDVTIRDFSGGLNSADNDLNLTTKFAKRLNGLHLGLDGSVEIQPGTLLFGDVIQYIDEIVNCFYFNGAIWCVGTNGKVVRVAGDGSVTLAFDDSIAAGLPGSPSGWVQTDFASFTISRGNLIIMNGVNKPLVAFADNTVQYLTDLASGSDLNVPICKFGVQHARYLVLAGDPLNPSTLYIGASDTTGTFFGDPDPNDGVNIDLSSRVPSGEAAIRGVGKFRDKLIVMFDEAILPGTLGIYDSADHVPVFDDAIEQHGAVSHLSGQTIGDDLLYCGIDDVNSISRALFTGAVKPDKESYLISPDLRRALGNLKRTSTLQDRVFSVYNSQEDEYMLFIPNADVDAQITRTYAFSYKKNDKLRITAWSRRNEWNFRSGCVSSLKRVFLTRGSQVYLLEGPSDKKRYYRNYVGDQETFDDGTTFLDGNGWSPVSDLNTSGVPIPFDWILPWSDNGKRMHTKMSRYLGLDTLGTANFKVQMFVDNIFNDASFQGETFTDGTLFTDDLGWDVEMLDPCLEMEFIGGEAAGYGLSKFGAQHGDGRPTSFEKLYAWVAKYKLFKIRIVGEADGLLQFVSLYMAYSSGSIRR